MKKILLIISAACTLSVNAQNTLGTKRVTIFKNGTALMIKEGNAAVKNGSATLPIPDQALFGTYFIGSAKDNSVKNIVFKNDTIKKQDKSRSVWQYLSGNMNKTVTISYTPTQGIDKSVTGKAVDYDLYSGMLKFVTDAGKTLVMHVSSIYQADFKEDPSQYYSADSIKRMMVLKPEKPADNVSLQEVFMTGGINWIPSYYLKLKDDKNARIEMKAVVENYAEDLREAETELVVGAPQMKYSSTPDPMTYDYLTTSDIVYAGGGATRNVYMQSNAITSAKYESAGDGGFFQDDFSTAGEKADDLYIYKLGKITLPKQSKGSFPIFAGNVEYKHKYEGSIYDITNYESQRFVPGDEKTFDIYHSLELKNTSTVPFTTAAVMVVNEKDQFVAQDELKYTPVGSSANIRLSKAVDIVMKNSEEEKKREDNAKKIGKVVYSKVDVKGAVNIANYQNKEVTVTVTKNLTGAVTGASDGGKITKKNPYSAVNPSSEIKWEVKLGANEKKTLSYEYEVFFTP